MNVPMDVSDSAGAGQSSIDVISPGGKLTSPGQLEMKGKVLKPSKGHREQRDRSFTTGNPNHRATKPHWRVAHDEKVKDKSRNSLESELAIKKKATATNTTESCNLKENLKPEELKTLREVLDVSKIDDVCPAVAAVALGRFDLIKKLIKDNQFDEQMSEGQRVTPLGCAIISVNWEMIQFLLDKRLSTHCKDAFGNTPLIKAASSSNWSENFMFDFWMMMKDDPLTDIKTSNKAGVTLIHILTFRGWEAVLLDVINYIEASEKDPATLINMLDATTWNGSTALSIAVDRAFYDITILLLSKGASPLIEDKAGFTAVCRSLVTDDVQEISFLESNPILQIILKTLEREEYSGWDFDVYMEKRIQVATNPTWESSSCFNERFYRLGKPIFLFILRRVKNGATLLLNNKIFSKLSTAGQKNSQQIDYVYSICLILFELLVYAEDNTRIYPQYVSAFIKEGAADFCLKVMQKLLPVIGDLGGFSGDSDQFSRSCELSTGASVSDMSLKYADFKENFTESLSYEEALPSDRNLSLTSLMPFIQLIDAPGMENWFSTHFQTLATWYDSIVNQSSSIGVNIPSSLSKNHIDRTNRKCILFKLMMIQDQWISPYGPKYPGLACVLKTAKHKRNRKAKKKSPRSVENYSALFPCNYLAPVETSSKPSQLKNEQPTGSILRLHTVNTGKEIFEETIKINPNLSKVPDVRNSAPCSCVASSAQIGIQHSEKKPINPTVSASTSAYNIPNPDVADDDDGASQSNYTIMLDNVGRRVPRHNAVSESEGLLTINLEPLLSCLSSFTDSKLHKKEQKVIRNLNQDIIHHKDLLFTPGWNECFDKYLWHSTKSVWKYRCIPGDYDKDCEEFVQLLLNQLIYHDDEEDDVKSKRGQILFCVNYLKVSKSLLFEVILRRQLIAQRFDYDGIKPVLRSMETSFQHAMFSMMKNFGPFLFYRRGLSIFIRQGQSIELKNHQDMSRTFALSYPEWNLLMDEQYRSLSGPVERDRKCGAVNIKCTPIRDPKLFIFTTGYWYMSPKHKKFYWKYMCNGGMYLGHPEKLRMPPKSFPFKDGLNEKMLDGQLTIKNVCNIEVQTLLLLQTSLSSPLNTQAYKRKSSIIELVDSSDLNSRPEKLRKTSMYHEAVNGQRLFKSRRKPVGAMFIGIKKKVSGKKIVKTDEVGMVETKEQSDNTNLDNEEKLQGKLDDSQPKSQSSHLQVKIARSEMQIHWTDFLGQSVEELVHRIETEFDIDRKGLAEMSDMMSATDIGRIGEIIRESEDMAVSAISQAFEADGINTKTLDSEQVHEKEERQATKTVKTPDTGIYQDAINSNGSNGAVRRTVAIQTSKTTKIIKLK